VSAKEIVAARLGSVRFPLGDCRADYYCLAAALWSSDVLAMQAEPEGSSCENGLTECLE
jgi:hypothetical protein